MTPEQEAIYALESGVARSDLPWDAQLAYDRLVAQRARAATPVPASRVGVVDSVRLAEKNMCRFAVTGWHDRLYFAWVPSDITRLRINMAYSLDGPEIMGKQRLAQRSGRLWGDTIPGTSLASSGGHLYLAWTGTDRRVNILADPQGPHGAPIRLDEARSGNPPALCSHRGGLVLAWTGTDGRINILADPQGPHGAPIRLDEARSFATPALCNHRGGLVLAWTGTDGHVNTLADPQGPHEAPLRLDEARSRGTPALCNHQGRLVLAWTGTDGHVNILADPQGPHDAPLRLDETTLFAPALCSHQDRLILAWPGNDGHLNLARLEWMQA